MKLDGWLTSAMFFTISSQVEEEAGMEVWPSRVIVFSLQELLMTVSELKWFQRATMRSSEGSTLVLICFRTVRNFRSLSSSGDRWMPERKDLEILLR